MELTKERVQDLEAEHVRKLIRQCLERCSASNMAGLVKFANMDPITIGRHLEAMINDGEVEVLRPCSSRAEGHAPESRKRRHFRLLRDTDGDYEWEREAVVRLPQGRLFDVGIQERRAETERNAAWWRFNRQSNGVLRLKYS